MKKWEEIPIETNQYRVCIVGRGRIMGGTIDGEVRDTSHSALPYSHAAGYTAADVVEEKAQYVCNKWDIRKYYLDAR